MRITDNAQGAAGSANADSEMKTADGQGNTKTGQGSSDAGNNTGKVEFTTEQQATIQRIIDEAYRKGFSKASAQYQSQGTGKDDEDSPKKADGKGKDTTLATEKLKSLEAQVLALREEKKTNALLKAIGKHNVIDAEEVATYVAKFIRLNDDNTFTVVNPDGQERMNAKAEPMSIEEMVAEWLKARPHHIRASGNAGAGSTGGKFGAGITEIETLNKLSPIARMNAARAAGIK